VDGHFYEDSVFLVVLITQIVTSMLFYIYKYISWILTIWDWKII
jgi:hypothetical protein